MNDLFASPEPELDEPARPARSTLPCPFCGNRSIVAFSTWRMMCHACQATGPLSNGQPGQAEALWNRRPPPAPPPR